jgi:hypothetical protein
MSLVPAGSAPHARKIERAQALPMRFRCEPIPRAAVRLVSPTMGHAKSGQGPMIRDVPKSTCRLGTPEALSLCTPFLSPVVLVAMPVPAFCSRVCGRR